MKYVLAILGLSLLCLLANPNHSDIDKRPTFASIDKTPNYHAGLPVPSDGAVEGSLAFVAVDHHQAAHPVPVIEPAVVAAIQSTRPPPSSSSSLIRWTDSSAAMNRIDDGEGRGPVLFPLLC